MPQAVRVWQVGDGDKLREYTPASVDLESHLEHWIETDVSIIAPNLLVIGRQVETEFGGLIDLLAIDPSGNPVIMELKRDKTPRDVTAQALDYASWVADLSSERIADIAAKYFGDNVGLERAFTERFDRDLPETLNESHRILIVGAEVDQASERIIKYLSGQYGVDINAVTFSFLTTPSGGEVLARVYLLSPAEVEDQARKRGGRKRRPSLSFDELAESAENHSVKGIYDRLVSGLERMFSKDTTRSSIRFVGKLDGSRKVLLSFLPEQSDCEQGLKFQIYLHRLARLLECSPEAIADSLPDNKQPWRYPGASEQDDGYEGFFRNEAEVDRFLARLETGRTR